MKAIITVVGKDQKGIIAKVCTSLAEHNVNIIDISQSIMDDYFNMFMMVELYDDNFDIVYDALKEIEKQIGVEVLMQRTEIFEKMYRLSGGQHDKKS